MEKIKTGIKGLDQMLHGGLIKGRPYLITGGPGTGKTLLSMQFLIQGLREDEEVLFVALDEAPEMLRENAASFNWDISSARMLDARPDIRAYGVEYPVRQIPQLREGKTVKELGDRREKTVKVTLSEHSLDSVMHDYIRLTLDSLMEMISTEMSKHQCKRMIIDSLTALRMLCIREDETRLAIQSFMKFLSELGATTLLTSESNSTAQITVEDFLAMGVIRLHTIEVRKGERIRAIGIDKMRGSSHDHNLRMFEITEDGFVVHPTTDAY